MGIVQTNLDGKVLNYFKSVKEASETLGIHRSLIYGVLQGKTVSSHGFRFFDADDYCKAMDEVKVEEEKIDSDDSDWQPTLVWTLDNGIMFGIPGHLLKQCKGNPETGKVDFEIKDSIGFSIPEERLVDFGLF